MRRALLSLLAIVAVMALLHLQGQGTLAFLRDQEASAGNTFTAGTLDLKVNGADEPGLLLACAPLQRGDAGSQSIALRNTGSLDGLLHVTIGPISSAEGDPSTVLVMAMACDGDTVSSGLPLSAWSGATICSLGLAAGQSRELVVSWELPDADASDVAVAKSVSFGIRFDLLQP